MSQKSPLIPENELVRPISYNCLIEKHIFIHKGCFWEKNA